MRLGQLNIVRQLVKTSKETPSSEEKEKDRWKSNGKIEDGEGMILAGLDKTIQQWFSFLFFTGVPEWVGHY